MKNALFLIGLLLAAACCNAQSKNLWATATAGGAYGFGTLLKGDSTGNNFAVVHSFDSINGNYPIGKMAVTPGGEIYIVTNLGGIADSCTICKYNCNTDSFAMIHQFFADLSTGAIPSSGVIMASNGLIYGATMSGGGGYDSLGSPNGGGVIYSIDPSTDAYTDVYNFPDTEGTGPTSELLQAADGNLYGIVPVASDSVSTYSYLFSFNPVNNHVSVLYKMNFYINIIQLTPRTVPLIQGPDLKLYGAFANVVTDTLGLPGILFSYDIAADSFSILHYFNSTGETPQGGLLAANGNIYGETVALSTINYGQIYSYNIANGSFTPLANFDTITGYSPVGGLSMLGNNLLAGSAANGGLYNNGTLFTFSLSSNTFSTLLDFDMPTTGGYPEGDILETGFPTTGITTLPGNIPGVALYPTITADYTNVYMSNPVMNGAYHLSVFDVAGNNLISQPITDNCNSIDCNNLASGVYIWRVLDENENVIGTGKLVKQ